MAKCAATVVLCYIFFGLVIIKTIPALRIPVGAIFGEGSIAAEKALDAEFRSASRNTVSLEYELFKKNVNMDDNYQVIQAATVLLKNHSIQVLVVNSLTPGILWFSKNKQLPVVSLEASARTTVPKSLSAEISPDPLRAVIDLMRFYEWTNLHYVYEDDEGLQRLQALEQFGSVAFGRLSSWQLCRVNSTEEVNYLLRWLDILHSASKSYLVLDLKPNFVARVLSDVSGSAHIEKRNLHFILMQPVDHELWDEPFMNELRVTGFRIYESGRNTDELPIIKTGEYGLMTQWLLARDAARLITEAYKRLALTDRQILNSFDLRKHGETLSLYIRNTFLNFGSTPGPLQLDKTGKRRSFTLELMESTPEGSIKAFAWSDVAGLSFFSSSYRRGRESDFTNKTLIVTSIETTPFLMKHEDKNFIGNQRYYGYIPDMLQVLSRKLGFSYKLKEVNDGKFGDKLTDGTWSGMIGEVSRYEADLAAAPLTINSRRLAVVDLSSPFMSVGISLMIKKPGRSSMNMYPGSSFFFMYPFSLSVWGYLLLAFVFFGVTHCAIDKFMTSVASKLMMHELPAKSSSLLNSFWFIFGGLFFRQAGYLPKFMSTRVLSGVWWVFSFFILSLYVANLISVLHTTHTNINGIGREEELARRTAFSVIEDFLETGFPDVGVLKGGSTWRFFQESDQPLLQRYAAVLNTRPDLTVRSYEEGIQRVMEGHGNYAFLMESSMNHYINQKQCETMMAAGLMDSKGYGFAMAKGSALSGPINSAIQEFHEQGILQDLHNKWWTPEQKCSQGNSRISREGLEFSPLKMSDLAGLFYVWLGGCLLTLLLSLSEAFQRRKSNFGMHLIVNRPRDQGSIETIQEMERTAL